MKVESERDIHENFRTGNAAKELNDYTHIILKSKNNFPKAERYLLAKDIQIVSNKIEDRLWYANDLRLDVPDEYELRMKIQRETLFDLKALQRMVERALRWEYISYHICETWTRHIMSVSSMLYNWHRKELKK